MNGPIPTARREFDIAADYPGKSGTHVVEAGVAEFDRGWRPWIKLHFRKGTNEQEMFFPRSSGMPRADAETLAAELVHAFALIYEFSARASAGSSS